jgi:hypothetical protein
VRIVGWLIGRRFIEVLRLTKPTNIGRFLINSFFITIILSYCFFRFPGVFKRTKAINVTFNRSLSAGDDRGGLSY